MSGVKINNIVKRSISLSPTVNKWAEEMAAERGFGTNFSAFIADLVRRSQAGEVSQFSDGLLSEAISDVTAKPVAAPVSYGSKRKAAGRSKRKSARGSSEKA